MGMVALVQWVTSAFTVFTAPPVPTQLQRP
jgi:hypothetical protein